MNRRASLDWSLQDLGMLIIGVACLAVLAFATVKILGLFSGGAADWRAERNLELLTQQIDAAKKQETATQMGTSSVVISLPKDRLLVGFSAADTSIPFEGGDSQTKTGRFLLFFKGAASSTLNRPKECKGTCICAFSMNLMSSEALPKSDSKYKAYFNIEFITLACKTIDGADGVNSLSNIEKITFDGNALHMLRTMQLTIPMKDGGRYFALDGMGPADLDIKFKDKRLQFTRLNQYPPPCDDGTDSCLTSNIAFQQG